MTATQSLTWADRWIGRPFVPRGRGPEGLDCYGLVREVSREHFATELPPWDDYADTRDRARLAEVVEEAMGKFERVIAPRAGDLVLFRVGGFPCHVGIVVAKPWFLHTLEGCDSALERWDVAMWARRVEGFYRWIR
jgi:cell wall-associated NlpC family hydrolase